MNLTLEMIIDMLRAGADAVDRINACPCGAPPGGPCVDDDGHPIPGYHRRRPSGDPVLVAGLYAMANQGHHILRNVTPEQRFRNRSRERTGS